MHRDQTIFDLIQKEQDRQEDGIELIASENFASPQVIEAMGTVLTNKYAEGLPGKRYYGGNEFVDISENLAIERAKKLLTVLDYKNIKVKTGDGYQGWVEHAPYDAIIVTAAPEKIPQPLIEQLATNGKMVIPVGSWYQDIIVLTKTEDRIIKEKTIPVRFVPMRRK